MNILAIETASKIGSLSLWQGESEKNWVGNSEVSRSKDLLPAIEKLLASNRLNKSRLDLVAVSEGPGSFTGLRVGLSVGQALAFSLGLKCQGVSMLEALAVAASFETDGKKEFTAIMALAKNSWCCQEFVFSKGLMVKPSMISLIQSEQLFLLIKEKRERMFVVDFDTYRRFFSETDGKKDLSHLICVGQNLATWVGLVAKGKPYISVEGPAIVPNYLL